jgi:NAD(P)-dependent dehydrogenase (short-subunit alcohol dehydrogenase family)
VDVLVNNAGVFTARRRLSPDGLELQLAVNHLAPFLLSHELMPLLAVPPEARLLTLSSGSHFGATFAETDLGQSGPYNSLRTYGRTKLACVLFTYELARRLGPRSRISTYAVDPGLVNTDMGLKDASALVRIVWLVRRRKGRTPAEGAKTTLCLASDSAASAQTGRYWKDCRAIPSSRQSYDEGSARRLWELSERLTGIGRFALPAFSQG